MHKVDWHVDRCRAVVYRRDTYRYTGRGPDGFEVHYAKEQCRRKPGHGKNGDLCWQHAKLEALES